MKIHAYEGEPLAHFIERMQDLYRSEGVEIRGIFNNSEIIVNDIATTEEIAKQYDEKIG